MENLLSPLSFSGLTLRNRIAMPPMWSGQATPEGRVTDQIVEYHKARAAAGCGLVIVEHAFVHPRGRHTAIQLGVHTEGMTEGLQRLAESVRAEGAVVCLQLAHAGSKGASAVLGEKPVAPSPVRHPYEENGEIPSELTEPQMRELAGAFALAAERARAAGFDAVEVHAAHGFLLSQFLSPLTNRRRDEYGGALENRARIHMEVLAEIRKRLGGDYPVFFRLGAHDETAGGLELEESRQVAEWLVEGGAGLIDVSGGLQGSRGTGKGPGYFVPYAEAIKAAIPVPVLVTGGIKDPVMADRIIREGRADLVGVGRAMLEDPQWARRAIETLAGAGN